MFDIVRRRVHANKNTTGNKGINMLHDKTVPQNTAKGKQLDITMIQVGMQKYNVYVYPYIIAEPLKKTSLQRPWSIPNNTPIFRFNGRGMTQTILVQDLEYTGVLISLWLFLFPIFVFAAQQKEFFLDGLNKLEQRSHKSVELRREYVG
jgi:hypothetical protein